MKLSGKDEGLGSKALKAVDSVGGLIPRIPSTQATLISKLVQLIITETGLRL